MTTAKILYNHFGGDGSNIHEILPNISRELFGHENWPNCTLEECVELPKLFIELYRGLYSLGIKYETIDECYVNGELDGLIHETYLKYQPDNEYYVQFCNKNLIIGNTYVKYRVIWPFNYR